MVAATQFQNGSSGSLDRAAATVAAARSLLKTKPRGSQSGLVARNGCKHGLVKAHRRLRGPVLATCFVAIRAAAITIGRHLVSAVISSRSRVAQGWKRGRSRRGGSRTAPTKRLARADGQASRPLSGEIQNPDKLLADLLGIPLEKLPRRIDELHTTSWTLHC